jgi:hypothetical protein
VVVSPYLLWLELGRLIASLGVTRPAKALLARGTSLWCVRTRSAKLVDRMFRFSLQDEVDDTRKTIQ